MQIGKRGEKGILAKEEEFPFLAEKIKLPPSEDFINTSS